MGIVQYFRMDGAKKFDVKQALADSGWNITLEELLMTTYIPLVDRKDPGHKVTVSYFTQDRLFEMWFVHYAEGGWQCLDHAIEQFALDKPPQDGV